MQSSSALSRRTRSPQYALVAISLCSLSHIALAFQVHGVHRLQGYSPKASAFGQAGPQSPALVGLPLGKRSHRRMALSVLPTMALKEEGMPFFSCVALTLFCSFGAFQLYGPRDVIAWLNRLAPSVPPCLLMGLAKSLFPSPFAFTEFRQFPFF
jgi:hypothetical protein